MGALTDDPAETLRELETALEDVTAAESALASALRELHSGVRAEKVTITSAVEDAFTRLRATRAVLATIRERVGSAVRAGEVGR